MHLCASHIAPTSIHKSTLEFAVSIETLVKYCSSSHIEKEDEGKVVFIYEKDFKSLASFFNLTENKYFQMREDKSMIEMAEIQGINKDDLFYYLVAKNYEALESAYNKGQVDLHFVMDYVLYLKEDVEQEMQAQ
ncbi:hypothetical protein [Lysinibacillus sp. RS5]|uniref:hypothetical protein n=1 Tax=unclassified Lysinibacillus TaxID=2636778 RepID=UPI0035BE6388